MSNKTYNQFCAIAHALDTVGERWTLIIVRNLLLGPKRFSDLMKGLPGISTNILTDRLKGLEDNGVVMTRFLPPPAASTVYQLTESGYALADALAALARWGSLTLGAPEDGQHIVSEGIGFMVMGVFRCETTPPITLTCDLHVRDTVYDHHFAVGLSPQGMTLVDDINAPADLYIQISLETLSSLSSGRVKLQPLIDSGEIIIDGQTDAVRKLVRWVDHSRR
jgi:DNA-binding HxlR family transcriptional regulator